MVALKVAPFTFPCTERARKTSLKCRRASLEVDAPFEVAYLNYYNRSTLQSGEKWERKQRISMSQSIASLRLSGYTSVVHVICGGDVDMTKYKFDDKVVLHHAPTSAYPLPRWANFFHRSTFEKIWYLYFSVQIRSRILCLDNDVFVFGSLSGLLRVPTPAYVVKPREGINSGVMLLHETIETVRQRIEYYRTVQRGGDGGDQRLLNAYHEREPFYELPSAYNVYSQDMNTSTRSWWKNVTLWHKPMQHLHGDHREYVMQRMSLLHNMTKTWVAQPFNFPVSTIDKPELFH